MSGRARRAVRAAGHGVEWVTGRPLASYDGPVAFETKVAVARAARHMERIRGRANVAFPGHVLLRSDPRGLARLAGRLSAGAVAVSASSGKTTTTAMLTSIAREAGLRPVTNPTGANMPPGLAAELLAASRPGRGTAGDLGVFEVDERWLPRVADDLGVRVMVLGNVLRDQVERMGDLDGVVAMWRRMISTSAPGLRLAVNVDDPRLAPLADLRPDPVRFGLDADLPCEHAFRGPAEPPPCTRCGSDLHYESVAVAHLGRWCCRRCGLARPVPDVAAEDVVLAGTAAARFTLRLPAGRFPVRLRVGGIHNVYNAVGAAAGATALGLAPEVVVAGLEMTGPAWGRGEVVRVDWVVVTLQVLKNAVGGAVLVRTVLEEPGPFDLLLAVTLAPDQPADVPYLWDVHITPVLERAGRVVCSGDLAVELAAWLKYAGGRPGAVVVEPSLAAGLRRAAAGGTGRLHVIASLRAAEELREQLADAGHVRRYWR